MPDADLDRDLRSIQEARSLGRAARSAQRAFESAGQDRVDAVVEAMATAGRRESERLARMAHEETGYGSTADKARKNDFVLRDVVDAMRGMRTVGVIGEDAASGVREIAAPVGVVAGIIPSTNPTSTALFKCLIAVKARCGIVLSPHPGARACIKAAADVMAEAAVAAGAPKGLIGCMTVVTMEGTRELMEGDATDVILATGGMGLVRAAYSAGKPAFGVGPGNVPAYVHASADVAKAVDDIFAGTTFDNGTLCSSEQSIICDRAIAGEVRDAVRARGGHFLDPDECRSLAEVLITDDLLVDPALVGQPATRVAEAAGIEVPEDTRVLICPQEGAGPDFPLSREKLSPVLAYYEVEDWREGCERCVELLRFGGMGHTLVIHSRDEDVVLEFGLHKPAHRVLVNTVAALGAIGHTTGLFPSMTLGCGSWGNNITSDNVGPQHLIDVKRLAREIRPLKGDTASEASGSAASGESVERLSEPATGRPGQEPTDPLRERVSDFLAERGIIRGGRPPGGTGSHVEDCGCEVCSDTTGTTAGAVRPHPPRGGQGGETTA
ncbi:MAG: aldehyde dehydrogenase family protein, partial [Acidobacteriota bacterium]